MPFADLAGEPLRSMNAPSRMLKHLQEALRFFAYFIFQDMTVQAQSLASDRYSSIGTSRDTGMTASLFAAVFWHPVAERLAQPRGTMSQTGLSKNSSCMQGRENFGAFCSHMSQPCSISS